MEGRGTLKGTALPGREADEIFFRRKKSFRLMLALQLEQRSNVSLRPPMVVAPEPRGEQGDAGGAQAGEELLGTRDGAENHGSTDWRHSERALDEPDGCAEAASLELRHEITILFA
jgi:hypothetical protein